MKKKTIIFKAAELLIGLILLLNGLTLPAAAYGRIDLGQKVQLTLQYPCARASFRIYRVASVSESREYTFTQDFSEYGVSINQPGSPDWRAVAETLSGYAARDRRQAVQSGKTDEKGTLVFSGLEPGMYLVVGEKCEQDDRLFESEPMLISLPNLNAEDQWEYTVTAAPKYEAEPIRHPVNLRVIKIWKDGDSKDRPTRIAAQLLRDDTVWDSVELSAENNWQYTFENLDERYTWKIVEKTVPQGYTVTAQTDNGTVVLTNTKKDSPTPSAPQLPQTGVLWWPVGILAGAGMLFLLIGWIRRKNYHAKKKRKTLFAYRGAAAFGSALSGFV